MPTGRRSVEHHAWRLRGKIPEGTGPGFHPSTSNSDILRHTLKSETLGSDPAGSSSSFFSCSQNVNVNSREKRSLNFGILFFCVSQ